MYYTKMNFLIGMITISLIVLFAFVSSGQDVPAYLNYQGKLVNPSTGQPIPDGNHNITFRICDNGTSGGVLWEDTYSVETKNGLFNQDLGPVDDFVFNGPDRWMEIEVEGEIVGARQKIVSVAYAIRAMSAKDADTLGGHPASDFGDGHSLDAADGSPTDAVFVDNDGNVGIRTSPQDQLDIRGTTRFISGGHVSPVDYRIYITGPTSDYDTLYIYGETASGSETFNQIISFKGKGENEVGIGYDAGHPEFKAKLAVNGNVGIGTTEPTAKLHLQEGSVLFSGTTGATPTSGAGTRMMWIPEKKAFRAGEATSTKWDADNIGHHSFAVGYSTKASGNYSSAMGTGTTASGDRSTATGIASTASGDSSTAIGAYTTASGEQSTALGNSTTASGDQSTAIGAITTASGGGSTAMGVQTTASGWLSTAMGSYASTNNKKGSFVYGDNSTDTTMNATANNQFMVRASGGTIFYSNSSLTSGVSLAPGGGSWSSISDRNKKENFKEEDGEQALRKIAGMSISSWNYKSQHPSIRHLGPTAQDFYAAFHLGESDTKITTADIDGINMLAIQALEKRTTELKTKIEELEKVKSELAEVKTENAEMKRRMAKLEATMQKLEALIANQVATQ